jgi:hypothetical protein
LRARILFDGIAKNVSPWHWVYNVENGCVRAEEPWNAARLDSLC